MLRKCASLVVLALVSLLLAAPAEAAAPVNDIMAGNRAAEKGDLDRAIKHFTAAIESGKLSKENLAIAYNNRGSALDDKGQTEKAIADYSKSISINPRYDAAYYNRSYAYERRGKLAEALQDMERAVQIEPDDSDFQQRLTYLKSKLAGTAN